MADLERFGNEYQTCPSCKNEVYDQSELCHICGHVFEEPASKPALWVLIVVAVVILSMLVLFIF